MSLDHLIDLARRTGDRLIIHNPLESQDVVIMTVNEYEKLIDEEEFDSEMRSDWYSAGSVLEEKYKNSDWYDSADDPSAEFIPSHDRAQDEEIKIDDIPDFEPDFSEPKNIPYKENFASAEWKEEPLPSEEPLFYEEPI